MPPRKDAIVIMFSKEQVRQRKLAHFLKTFGPLNAMMKRAGMTEMNIYHRTRTSSTTSTSLLRAAAGVENLTLRLV